jgi:hypothetical protein
MLARDRSAGRLRFDVRTKRREDLMINRILTRFGCAAAIAAGLLTAQPALAQKVALVIGNSEYKNVFSLKNPVNDAADMGEALKRIGFEVTALSNAPVADMRRTLKEFGEKAKLADVAVVFYSGHALQSDGVAWLLATDGQARNLADITKGSLSLPEVLEQLDGVEKVGMVFIDAARNDPFNEAAKRQLPSGLKRQVEEPKNVMVSFATGSGRKVADGEGRNSPFTTALLKHIEEPGIELIAFMKKVRDEVVRSTAGEQVPSFYISASDDAYFVAALPKPEPVQPEPPAAAPAPIPAPQAVTPEAPAAAPAPAPQAAVPAPQAPTVETPAAPVPPPAPQAVAPEAPAAPESAPQALAPAAPLEPASQPLAPVTPAAPEAAPEAAPAAPAAPVEKAAQAPQPAAPEPAPSAAPAAEADKPATDSTSTSTEPNDKVREGSDSTEKKHPND